MLLRAFAILVVAIGLLLAGGLLPPGPAWAQATAEEEANRRASVLENTPEWAAKVQFGKRNTPAASLEARAIGSYARGCLAGAMAS